MEFLAPKNKKLVDDTSGRNTRDKSPPQQPSGQSRTPESHAEVWPLSTKPFFCVTLDGYHLAKNNAGLAIPRHVHENLPNDPLLAKIVYGGKAWYLNYLVKADNKRFEGEGLRTFVKRFEGEGWRTFVKDNNLKIGDVCVFEMTEGSSESNSIEFRVQFLKDDFPTELLEKAPGYLADNPISLD